MAGSMPDRRSWHFRGGVWYRRSGIICEANFPRDDRSYHVYIGNFKGTVASHEFTAIIMSIGQHTNLNSFAEAHEEELTVLSVLGIDELLTLLRRSGRGFGPDVRFRVILGYPGALLAIHGHREAP